MSLHVSAIYMTIFRSTGCVLLHVMFGTRCCGCGRIQTYTQCIRLHTDFLGPQP